MTDPLPITVITTCKGRLHHLSQSLPLLAAQPGLHCIVVDDGCPDRAGDWVESRFSQVEVVRSGASGAFNISRARNLGASRARTPWLCFMDVDTLVGPDLHADLSALLREGHFYLADPCPHELVGMVVCRRDDYLAVGGYDEVFSGWGCEDRDFYDRLRQHGSRPTPFPATAIQIIRHDDSERTRHHEVGDRFLSLRINGMYLQIKRDLARLLDKPDLALVDRQELYARIRQRVLADPQATARMDVTLPHSTLFTKPPGWQLHRTVSYCFEPLNSFAGPPQERLHPLGGPNPLPNHG